MDHKHFFKKKKITLMGLGLLGRGLADVAFLAECGAQLTVTDLKSKDDLAPTLKKLKKYKNIRYVLGEHRLEDFSDCDMVIKAAGVPLDSSFIAHARSLNIPIEMDESLFAKCAPDVRIIGITGTRGKTTTTMLIYSMLLEAKKTRRYKGDVFLGGNILGLATLPLLKKVKPGDTMVLELSSWQLQGFGEAHISPHIAVFTNFLDDHLNYYNGDRSLYWNDKAYIFSSQSGGDFFVAPKELLKKVQSQYPDVRSHFVVPLSVPSSWNLKIKGAHNHQSVVLAIAVGGVLGITDDTMKKAVEQFSAVEGRLEHVATIQDIEIYNDTTSTTPDSLRAALSALGESKNIVLIMGGADKNLDMQPALKQLPLYASTVILLSGEGTSGTEKIKKDVYALPDLHVIEVGSIDEALKQAFFYARNNERILFSPGFASFGMFKNEFDRGEKFMVAVKRLKTETK